MAYMKQRGVGSYRNSGDWTWEFYPPPYDFLAPSDSAPMPAPVLFTPGVGGLSGCHCGGRCGGHGCGRGGVAGGLGLFDSGLDLSQWGIGEWAIAGAGLYLALSLFGDTRKVAGKVRVASRAREAKQKRRERLERELRAL